MNRNSSFKNLFQCSTVCLYIPPFGESSWKGVRGEPFFQEGSPLRL